MLGLSSYDVKVIRQEGDDTRKQIKVLQADIRTSNNILSAILTQLNILNERMKNK